MKAVLQIRPLTSHEDPKIEMKSINASNLAKVEQKKKVSSGIKIFNKKNSSQLSGIVGSSIIGGIRKVEYIDIDSPRSRSHSRGKCNASSFDIIKGDSTPQNFKPHKKMYADKHRGAVGTNHNILHH